jgi:uncharacterized protein YcaQ
VQYLLGQKGGWWNWKPEKIALEYLHLFGELMIARRHNFQRIYDLRARVVPWWNDANAPPLEDVYAGLCEQSLRCLGLATTRWVPDYFRTPKHAAAKQRNGQVIQMLLDAGRLLPVAVEGLAEPAYVHADHAALLDAAAAGDLAAERTVLLSPFDPVVWDRARAKALWDFEYRIECYTPAPKRQYGYFTLPILHRGRLVGRLDPKAHRTAGRFEVRALHLEPDVALDAALIDGLGAAVRACAAWHGTPEVTVAWAGTGSVKAAGVAEAVEAAAMRAAASSA